MPKTAECHTCHKIHLRRDPPLIYCVVLQEVSDRSKFSVSLDVRRHGWVRLACNTPSSQKRTQHLKAIGSSEKLVPLYKTALSYIPEYLMYVLVGNSISKLQIQVTTYVFELSAGNCHRQMAALSSFTVTRNERYAHDCKDGAAVTRWRRP